MIESINEVKKLNVFGITIFSISYNELRVSILFVIIDFPNMFNEQFEGKVLARSESS